MLVTKDVLEQVTAYGMTPYNLDVLGDHRGMYMDINTRKLLGSSNSDMNMVRTRRLRSIDSRCTKKYLDHLREKIKHHKIDERLKKTD